MQGDVDCNGGVTSVDALKILRHITDMPVPQNEPCPNIGSEIPSPWGDVDCSDNVVSVDSLKILRYVAGQSVAQWEPCVGIGLAITN
jgi:hypothetical protein